MYVTIVFLFVLCLIYINIALKLPYSFLRNVFVLQKNNILSTKEYPKSFNLATVKKTAAILKKNIK